MKPDARMLARVGSLSQIAGTRHAILTDGAAHGLRAIDVTTGGGLKYTILPDRGMDIGLASYKGINLSYLSPQGEVYAMPAQNKQDGWLRSFFGGLLTTCGPLNFGPACEDEGEILGMHGLHNVTAAQCVCDATNVEEGTIAISGRIGQYVLFGEKVETKRTIRSCVGENAIHIEDTVTNHGDADIPYMMLYHINFGYPLLDECAAIHVNSLSCEGYDAYSQEHIGEIGGFSAPCPGRRELNYLHKMDTGKKGIALLRNTALKIAAEIEFDTAALPYLTQWKSERARDYVLALEPCSAPCKSREELRKKDALPFLRPGEQSRKEVLIRIKEL